jgi:hypothetical protein
MFYDRDHTEWNTAVKSYMTSLLGSLKKFLWQKMDKFRTCTNVQCNIDKLTMKIVIWLAPGASI